MDAVSIRTTSQDRSIAPAREGTKRDAQDQRTAEQVSQAEARNRARQQEQQSRLRRELDKDMAEQQSHRLRGRLVRIGDNRGIENTAEARAGVMRDKVQRAYTSASEPQGGTINNPDARREAADMSADNTPQSVPPVVKEPIDLVI